MVLSDKKLYTMDEWSTANIEGVTLTAEDDKSIMLLERNGRITIKPYSAGVIVETGPYVGAVSLNNFDLLVRPKFENDRHFFKLIGYAFELDDFLLLEEYVDLSFARGWFTDVLVACLVKEMNKIILQGLLKRYQEKQENLLTPHGKIDFTRLAGNYARGSVSVPCRYEDLSFDVIENRILLATLSMVRPWISSPTLFARVQYLEQMLSEGVFKEKRIDYLLVELEKKEDRQGLYYRRALELCKMIFRSIVFTFEGEESSYQPAFLINMNELFERFIARLLMECAPPGYRIYYQSGMGGYFSRAESRSTVLKPDYQIFLEDHRIFLADAKYKLYDQRKVDPADLYQLAVYQMVGEVENAMIYYPSRGEKNSNSYELRRPDGSYLLHTQVIGIPLETFLEHINERGTINKASQDFIWEQLTSIPMVVGKVN